jgi:acetyl/propionyl-CoA carboxylase alpha subunit
VKKVLVANRGEVALRIFRACRELGLTSVSAYGAADEGNSWTYAADEAVALDGRGAADTYLDHAVILAAAERAGADAVHPGYGFLAESPAFAAACEAAAVTFVGPTARAMNALGTKAGVKRLAEAAGLPTVPGFDAHGLDAAELERRCRTLGLPVLVKASAGGGGRGMRLVNDAAQLAEEIRAARAEAMAAFGDDHVIVERYFPHARHVEVQILADAHGKVLHLLERDCSVQRRHQMLIEESPAPGVSAPTRSAMVAAAVELARAGGYTNAGTVEFLLDDSGAHYLLEMNARLQVEHAVTEAVCGLDLAAWQLRIAAGEPLSFEQEQVTSRGHAIEARIYAEDPASGFLPSAGRLEHYRPPSGPGVRCDDGVAAGDEISGQFDALLAKVIAHGADRASALARLAGALRETIVVGVATNTAYLIDVLEHEAFRAGAVHTRFLEEHLGGWMPALPGSEIDWLLAAAAEELRAGGPAAVDAAPTDAGRDPWAAGDGWSNAP